MPLGPDFKKSASPDQNSTLKRRPAPFCLRLSEAERARLSREAAGAPLGSYIKAKALGSPPARIRRPGISVEDRSSLARALALLGQKRFANNLNQLAHLGNIGSLPMTPETEEELRAALLHIRQIRDLLISALGLRPEAGQ